MKPEPIKMSPALTGISPKEKHRTHRDNMSFPSKPDTNVLHTKKTPNRMRPVLKGQLKKVERNNSEVVVWEGCWSMREEDLNSVATDELDTFYYERVKTKEADHGNTPDILLPGYFSGHFSLRKPVNGSSSPRTCIRKHVEKDLHLRFTPASDNTYQVNGSGQNKFGKFNLEGTFDKTTGVLLIRRDYIPRKPKINRKASFNRVARELGLDRQHSDSSLRVESNSTLSEGDRKKSLSLLEELMKKDTFKWFCSPVDADKLGLHDYHQIVTTPMDLGTIQTKLNSSYYSVQQMLEDVRLTFQNAIHYNPRGHAVYRKATDLLEWFLAEYEATFEESRYQQTNGKLDEEIPVSKPMSKIGKRTRVPKVTFAPELAPTLKRSRSSSSLVRSSSGSRSKRRSASEERRSLDSSESAELVKLREQVQKLSNHLTRMGSAMIETALPASPQPAVPAQPRVQKKDRPLTFDEKQRLGSDIHRLPGHKISKIVEIIENNGDSLGRSEDGDMELDIDSLKPSTLHKLKVYVARHRNR